MIKNFAFNVRRAFNRLIHRYIIVSLIAFILSRLWIFNNPSHISVNRLVFVVLVLVITAFFLGKRSALYACFINIGFLVSMLFYGENNLLEIFPHLCWPCRPSINVVVIWICLAFSPMMLILSHVSNYKINKQRNKMMMTRTDLYKERQEKFDEISKYITNHSIVGINSVYGNGKSTIVEALKNQKKEWNFITISLLSTKVENVEFIIVREIERFLESKGIYTNSISKIKSLFSHDFSFCIGELLFEKQSYEDQMKNFLDDIRCLKKVIVLNFEDIDRISDKEHVKKIFAICDSLIKFESKFPAEDRFVKIIYQCNIEALNEMFKNEDDEKHYVEKFIPYIFSLNSLLGDFFKRVLEKNQERYKELEGVKFEFLNDALKKELLQQEVASFSFYNHSVRGVEQILDNVNSVFERNRDLSVSKLLDVEPVIIFYIVKYFMPHIYEKLDENLEMIKQKIFYDKDGNVISFAEIRDRILFQKENEKSIYGAMSFRTVVGDFFDEKNNKKFKENRDALLFLVLLGYNDDFFNKTSNTAEKYNIMKRKEEVLNRLIRLS